MNSPAILPWTVDERRTLVSDRWLTLHADTCRTADGVLVAPYYVTDPSDWVQVIAIDPAAEHVLLVEQYRHGARLVSLEVPGGCVDAGEAPTTAAARELLEETGCAGGTPELLVSLCPNPATQSNRCHTVLIRDVREVAAPHDDPVEQIIMRWVPIAEVVALARSGAIVQAMHVAALALALTHIGRWEA